MGPDGANNINIIASNATVNAGSSVLFVGNPGTNTITFNVTDVNNGTLIGLNAGNLTIAGINNTGVGHDVLHAVTTGANNTAIGESAGVLITSSAGNTALGSGSLATLTTGTGHNTAVGFDSLLNLATGVSNTVIGYQAGQNYTGAESNNIVIGNTGTLGDSAAIRIGTSGTQTQNFQAGIAGVTVSNQKSVVINSATGQLGVDAGGITIQTITGNDGVPESPLANNFNFLTANATPKFVGSAATETIDFNLTNLVLGSALPSLTSGSQNVGVGSAVLAATTSGQGNAVVGYQAGTAITSGTFNTLMGFQAGTKLTVATGNVAIGDVALANSATNSNFNTAVGYSALFNVSDPGGSHNSFNVGLGYEAGFNITTGNSNICIGKAAGGTLSTGSSNVFITVASTGLTSGSGNIVLGGPTNLYSGSESNNILISNAGVNGESNVMRLGTSGSGTSQVNKCFIAGIDGVSVGSTAQVVTEVSGQLGSAVITAGTGISVTTAANTITISTSGTSTLTYTSVNHAASPYTVLTTDEYIAADVTAGVISILLPNAPSSGRVYTIKDKVGLSGTSNITVTTVGGAVTIDGATSFVMNTNYESINVLFNGTSYEVF